MEQKPYSAACERNQAFIVAQLNKLLLKGQYVLEVGSGTGQHAVYFGRALPEIIWQTSDLVISHPGINIWLHEANLPNVLAPITLDVSIDSIPANYDVIFTANTFHIMAWENVVRCIQKVGHALKDNGLFIVYGPFKFNNMFTSISNAEFDATLKKQYSQQGIRDFEAINEIAQSINLFHQQTISMPANNVMLIFHKRSSRDS